MVNNVPLTILEALVGERVAGLDLDIAGEGQRVLGSRMVGYGRLLTLIQKLTLMGLPFLTRSKV
jgi:hypothetical protein